MCDSLFYRRKIKLAIEDGWQAPPLFGIICQFFWWCMTPIQSNDFSLKPEAKSGSPLGFCLFVYVHLNSAGKKRDGLREFTCPASSLETWPHDWVGHLWFKCLKIGFAPGLPVRPRDTPHRWVRTNFGPTQTTEPPWHKPMVVNGVVVGPFEEEEEGTSIASDVVKVKGEDPATPGPLT